MSIHIYATETLSSQDYHALIVFEGTRILQTIAWDEIHRNNRHPREFIVICFEGDPTLSEVILVTEERAEWRKVHSQKTNPIVYGIVPIDSFQNFLNLLPVKADGILNFVVDEGYVKALVCTKGAIEVMQIRPNNFGYSQ